MAEYTELMNWLDALSDDRKAQLVVQSQPFGRIIEDDTGRLHGRIRPINGGPQRRVGQLVTREGNDWQWVAYGICHAAGGCNEHRKALQDAGYI